MQTSSKKLLLIGAAAVLTVSLYFAPKKNISTSEVHAVVSGASFESMELKAKGNLKRQEAETLTPLENALKNDPSNVTAIESLAQRWDALKNPALSAHYYELKAEITKDEKTWLNAAYRYFDAFRMTEDSVEKKLLVDKAIASYESVLKINPDNLNAKTDLGICYTEASENPMKGIMMLREVVEKDPEHENAQFNLGVLSMRSGQYDKAIDRFKKVLSIDNTKEEMFLAIGRAYYLKGEHGPNPKEF